ncbi:MAG TPA: glycogen-binding domain-containing protein, partial [Gemmatimonadaceae bacterium]|nr:glycogen-binding domain-containing protein [Gemmatimonadaceae bacterium]
RAWSDFSVVLPFVGNNALIIAAGSAPLDPVRATLAATYVSVSTRVMLGTLHRTTPLARMIAALNHVSVAGDMNADGSRTVTIVLPTAHTVDLMGDFTAWRPIAMTRAPNGVWVTRVALSPGSHAMNIRVDGSSWRAPPGLPVAPDDFGGVVGLLVIH